MIIGAHVGTSGGLDLAPGRGAKIGARAIQIFASIPQTWRKRNLTDEQVQGFRAGMVEHRIHSAFIHGIYLVNLATPTPEQLVKSEDSLITDMTVASRIGAKGVIFHVGIFRTPTFEEIMPQIVDGLIRILEATPEDALLIIENAAGERKGVGARFFQTGALIRAVASPRLVACLDTAHAFASGYDITQRDALDQMMDEFDHEVGYDRLVAVHANDSKVACGSGVDRHENIGEGHIGLEGWGHIVAHPAFHTVPLLMEVPGFEKEGPDERNVEILKSLAEAEGVAVIG